ncbi:MAG TPA: hypothetical protein VFF11_07090, partial [Candidatus Binatia bacterium]|nr:hypothetical protein [Candidatus Binatia bacterium]
MIARLKILLLAMFCFIAADVAFAQDTTNRPANWAQPVAVAGIENCYEVTTNLYRGAQPTAEGMKHLKA